MPPAARPGFYQELLGEKQEAVSLLMSPSENFTGFMQIPQVFMERGLSGWAKHPACNNAQMGLPGICSLAVAHRAQTATFLG